MNINFVNNPTIENRHLVKDLKYNHSILYLLLMIHLKVHL